MANVFIEETTMKAIGNAIRGKNGSTSKYLPEEMPAQIDAIVTGDPNPVIIEDMSYSVGCNGNPQKGRLKSLESPIFPSHP